jgi:hypothetical protein
VVDSLLDDGHRLEQHADLRNVLRNLVQPLRRLGVVLRHEAVSSDDATLLITAVVAHVVHPGLARVALARATHGRHDEIAGLETLHLLPDLFDDTKILVAEYQILIAFGRLAVEPMADLSVGTAQAGANHLHGDLIRLQLRIGHVAHVDGIFHAGLDDDGLHGGSP